MRESDREIVAVMNANRPRFIDLLGGEIHAIDTEARTCEAHFCVPLDYCHSIDVVQGGFIAAMLDTTVSHAVFACDPEVKTLATLELTTHYLGVTRGNTPIIVTGHIEKLTYKTAFLDGRITTADGEVTAMVRSVAKLGR